MDASRATAGMDGIKSHLYGDIKDGKFVPFLGAGASSLRPRREDLEEYPWNQLLRNLSAVHARVAAESDRRFLLSLVARRLGLRDLDIEELSPLGQLPQSVEDPRPKDFVRFQAALVQAAAGLTEFLGGQLAEQPGVLTGLGRIEVPFNRTYASADSNLVDLLESLAFALRLSKKGAIGLPFTDRKHAQVRNLQMGPVYRKLLCLCLELLPQDESWPESDLRLHQIAIRTLPATHQQSRGGSPLVRLDSLQWLLHLIWHTFRFWIPRYPTTAELAFEIFLYDPDAISGTLDLKEIAERVEYVGSVSELLTEVLKGCEAADSSDSKRTPASGTLHLAIATSLQVQFESYQRRQEVSQDPLDRWRSEEFSPGTHGLVSLPIALTTNYDRMLELAFRRLGLPYHVLFPVARDTDFRGALATWCLRSYGPHEPCENVDHLWQDLSWNSPQQQFLGPLIVKLHGSPLEDLPKGTDRHVIVMSESSYLTALRDDLRLPEWVWVELEQSSIWMMGYSLSDIHIRLWIGDRLRGRRLLLRHPEEPEFGALLHSLRVQIVSGDLRVIAPTLFRILEAGETKHYADVLERARLAAPGLRIGRKS
jgi:hypothetical protein